MDTAIREREVTCIRVKARAPTHRSEVFVYILRSDSGRIADTFAMAVHIAGNVSITGDKRNGNLLIAVNAGEIAQSVAAIG